MGAAFCRGLDARALTISLGGLSKSAGLPQVKLAWMALDGPNRPVEQALQRLEVICDTFLSVSTPVQVAAPRLIDAGREVRAAILSRLCQNLDYLRMATRATAAVSLLDPEAGWSAVLRVPATEAEDALVVRLLEEARVLVHPGYFFDFDTEAFLVVSLLPEPAQFSNGVDRVMDVLSKGPQ